jgi:hypothetical protein
MLEFKKVGQKRAPAPPPSPIDAPKQDQLYGKLLELLAETAVTNPSATISLSRVDDNTWTLQCKQ